MSASEDFDWSAAFDQMDEGYDDGEFYMPRRPRLPEPPKTCRHCSKKNLYWVVVDGKWRLGKKGKEHKCDLIGNFFKRFGK